MAQSAKLSGDFQDAPAGKVKPGGGGGAVSCIGRTQNIELKVPQTEAIVDENYSFTGDSYKILVS